MKKLKEYVRDYSYLVEYSPDDEAYVSRCLELGILAHGETHEDAIHAIKEATSIHLQMLIEDGEEIPEAFSVRDFSGKLNLRMTPEKHKRIAIKAKRQGVSINQYINNLLI